MTYLHQDIDSIWIQALEDLLDHGQKLQSRIGETRELVGFTATLEQPWLNLLGNKRRKLSKGYAAAEFLWYMMFTHDTKFLKLFAPQYANFEDYPDYANGSYGARMNGQLHRCIQLLKDQPNTRQAVINLWQQDVGSTSKDLPCTLTLQFLIREDELHMITTMRSNDIWLGMPYDIFTFTCLQLMVAATVGVGIGLYTHQAGSLHLYEKDYEKAREALATRQRSEVTPHSNGDTFTEVVTTALCASALPELFEDVTQTPMCKFLLKEVHNDYRRRYGLGGKDDAVPGVT